MNSYFAGFHAARHDGRRILSSTHSGRSLGRAGGTFEDVIEEMDANARQLILSVTEEAFLAQPALQTLGVSYLRERECPWKLAEFALVIYIERHCTPPSGSAMGQSIPFFLARVGVQGVRFASLCF